MEENMNKFVCLRDDDTNYHTRTEELVNAYGEFWGQLPITLAVVPFSHGSQQKVLEYQGLGNERDTKHREWVIKATAEELTEYHRVWPIGLNKELVTMLKPLITNGMIEIALHGVHHAYNERGPEMFSNETGYEAIRDGKEYLEKLFETEVETFIPPSNTIDIACVGYLKRLNMHLFSSGTIYRNNTNKPSHDIRSIFVSARRRILCQHPKPMKKNYGIMQFSSHTFGVNDDVDVFVKKMKCELEMTGFSALGTHYMLFNDVEYSKRYRRIIQLLQDELKVKFVTAKDYYKLIFNRYYA